MPYVGEKLARLPKAAKIAARVAMRDMADKGADRLLELTVENTPIDTDTPGRGGNLRTSWYRTPAQRKMGDMGAMYEARVATNVDYAPHVEYGTGLWGPSHAKYPIVPKKPGGYLRWRDPKTGEEVFARKVMHPGSPGQHMLGIAAAVTQSEVGDTMFASELTAWALTSERIGA